MTFSVRISDKDANVDDLKEQIKKKKHPAFELFPADALDLWKVSIPDDKVMKTTHLCDLKPKQDPLRGVKRLDHLFPDTPDWRDEHIHVIVRPPGIVGVS